MARTPKPAGPAPDMAQLRERALRHLARFAATEAGLIRVLDRGVQRWARVAETEGIATVDAVAAAKTHSRAVAAAMVASGAVNDAAFAVARAGRLARAGRSRRATSAHLAGKGVTAEVARAALPHADELASALAYARRRRIGPFRTGNADAEQRLRELGALARAGFPREVAERALRASLEEATAIVQALKRG